MSPPREQDTPRGDETIFLVEDDEQIRQVVRKTLEAAGYRAIAARNGAEALDAARRHDGHIALVVTDLVMPGMSGREMADELEKNQPGLRFLFVSGYSDDVEALHRERTNASFLQKPFAAHELMKKVREVLDDADGAERHSAQ
jgi:DNA-binding NtrC family response regulator